MKSWSWTEHSDDEYWRNGLYTTKEEAIVEAVAVLGEDAEFFVGQCEEKPLVESVDPDQLLEQLDAEYCDETCCEDYIYEGVDKEHVEWLGDEISKVIKEFHLRADINPGWFDVFAIERVKR